MKNSFKLMKMFFILNILFSFLSCNDDIMYDDIYHEQVELEQSKAGITYNPNFPTVNTHSFSEVSTNVYRFRIGCPADSHVIYTGASFAWTFKYANGTISTSSNQYPEISIPCNNGLVAYGLTVTQGSSSRKYYTGAAGAISGYTFQTPNCTIEYPCWW